MWPLPPRPRHINENKRIPLIAAVLGLTFGAVVLFEFKSTGRGKQESLSDNVEAFQRSLRRGLSGVWQDGDPRTVELKTDAGIGNHLRSFYVALSREPVMVPLAELRRYKAGEILDETCSFVPDSVKDLDFPLRTKNRLISVPSASVWFFESGVVLRADYLNRHMIDRFRRPDQRNIWEVVDEPLMMKGVADLYHRCEQEECVFVDGGAAFGYYSQLIRIHFPLVRVLAFNPHPKFAEQMIDNLSVAEQSGVCLQQKGLSDAPGSATIKYGVSGKIGKGSDYIEVVTLDDYYEDFGKDKLVVGIKLDIEGHGGKAIRGGPKMMAAAQNVFIGVHNLDELTECQGLESAGFILLDKSKFPEGSTPNGLCVATRNYGW